MSENKINYLSDEDERELQEYLKNRTPEQIRSDEMGCPKDKLKSWLWDQYEKIQRGEEVEPLKKLSPEENKKLTEELEQIFEDLKK
ncbi:MULTISPECIES: hypothetical protein [Klebsiella pneumoniae complex]|uniref:hypothetical protein n=1 Tax=Klebsiella pneumoniae complex TaxID=3390273 RepID=UPI000D74110D|nr:MULTISPECIES: hypothetical protein [Klebsiella]HCM5702544.1 hypothetical protein [Klebsiella pneumoniae]HDH1371774.1 hypothetical protein [Klebsiella quasipneumoniae subsp. similipneumoniae]MCD9673042.1 hypothetical protein [Klebsiella variicola subsp. variicola]PXH88809.1 hypothetical protein DMQ72_25770 [Klebsiella quasipneumoniae]HCM5719772.1 hypothetical protein [Klebsiella pneumoniae]